MLAATRRHKRGWLCCLSLCIILGCESDRSPTDEYPRRPIKLIVPFGTGGGSDTFSRILAKAIEDHQLLPHPIVIINVPGAGGTIGSRRVKGARPDGYTIMQLHEGILTSKYSRQATYGPEAFEPIAGMGSSPMIVGVGENSPYQSLTDLMKDVVERPDEVVFSANIGAPSQYVGLMLEQVTPGAQFRYAQTGDGAKRFTGLQGGHTDVSSFSLAEYMQFKPAGLRALAILDNSRHAEAEEIPTAIEQGFDVVSTNMQFWWAPQGTPPQRLEILAAVLQQAMQTVEVRERLTQLRIQPIVVTGEALNEELVRREARAASVAQKTEFNLPNFPLWTAVIVAAIAAVCAIPSQHSLTAIATDASASQSPRSRRSHWQMGIVLGVTVVYVASMQSGQIGYSWTTFIYLMTLGLTLSSDRRRQWMWWLILAAVLSFGLSSVFTQVFVIDLP